MMIEATWHTARPSGHDGATATKRYAIAIGFAPRVIASVPRHVIITHAAGQYAVTASLVKQITTPASRYIKHFADTELLLIMQFQIGPSVYLYRVTSSGYIWLLICQRIMSMKMNISFPLANLV